MTALDETQAYGHTVLEQLEASNHLASLTTGQLIAKIGKLSLFLGMVNDQLEEVMRQNTRLEDLARVQDELIQGQKQEIAVSAAMVKLLEAKATRLRVVK
jgi:hypothetical protein